MAVEERAKAESKGLIFSNRGDNMYAKQREVDSGLRPYTSCK